MTGNCNVYTKPLKRPELGLFDEIEVRTPREFENKTVCFIVSDTRHMDVGRLQDFINLCFSVYGADDSPMQRGRFTDDDLNALERRDWKGRNWEKSNPKVQILFVNDKLEARIRH